MRKNTKRKSGILALIFVILSAVFANVCRAAQAAEEAGLHFIIVDQVRQPENVITRPEAQLKSADQAEPGRVITEEEVKRLGLDSFFYVEEISDELFQRMWGKSYKEYCTVPREDLRYIRLLHKDIDGVIKVGELVMNALVADKVCEIFRKLYDADYPFESVLLVDDFDADDENSIMHNNTSAFNYRTVDNTEEISNHAYGLAIDINPYYNVYYIPSQNYVFPYDGWQYLDREKDFPYKLVYGDICYNLFTEAGFEWGGWWTYNTDYQHFQYPAPDYYSGR